MRAKKSRMWGSMQRSLSLLMLIYLLTGCSAPSPEPAQAPSLDTPQTRTVFAMDTVMDLTVYSPSGIEALEICAETIKQLDGLFSATDSKSEIYTSNHNGSANISATTADLVSQALGLCQRTDGALDITIYPVIRSWGFTTDNMQVPDSVQLETLLSSVDYSRVSVSDGILVLPEGAMIDLGAVAKGYCGDQLAAIMRESGVTCALMCLGGNIHTVGTKPDGEPWRVAVQDPILADQMLGVLSVEDQAVVTSGGYERYFEQGGQTYWHIIDPKTGYPAQSRIVSVTVVGDNGLLCDALSTALFVMGLDAALEYYHSFKDFEAVIFSCDANRDIYHDCISL